MTPSEKIDQLIESITDWRGKTFAAVRKCILAADREIVEDWKWMGSPVWYRDGLIAVANAHKGKVKLTFAYGASLPDPDHLFNAGLEGNARRAIDFLEGDKVNARALKQLIRAAVGYNRARKTKAPAGARAKVASLTAKPATRGGKPPKSPKSAKTVLVSGGTSNLRGPREFDPA